MAKRTDIVLDDSGERGRKLSQAQHILEALDFDRPRRNERSALILLALLNLQAEKSWQDAQNPQIGITPMMDWCSNHYGAKYAPNSRETFRRATIHQFMEAALVVLNPDNPQRDTNSKDNVYQVEPTALELLRTYGTAKWDESLAVYKKERPGLQVRYAKIRDMQMIPVTVGEGKEIKLTPGKHSDLIRAVIADFAGRYTHGGKVLYIGDTGEKWGHFDIEALRELGVTVDMHGKMPDVVIYDSTRNWLLLVEAVTSHGPVDGKRHDELARLFKGSTAGLVYVTAFPTRKFMARYLSEISWETEVWVAEAPDHLIHFNGIRFLGPYAKA